MGYDITLTHPDTPSNSIGNMTYNVRPMYDQAFGTYWKDELNGKIAGDTVSQITKAVSQMELNPEDYKPLEPKNKWGTYEQALSFLKEIEAECYKYPKMQILIY